jgi:hypothetical protein
MTMYISTPELVASRIAQLEAEAAAENLRRIARSARSPRRTASVRPVGPGLSHVFTDSLVRLLQAVR